MKIILEIPGEFTQPDRYRIDELIVLEIAGKISKEEAVKVFSIVRILEDFEGKGFLKNPEFSILIEKGIITLSLPRKNIPLMGSIFLNKLEFLFQDHKYINSENKWNLKSEEIRKIDHLFSQAFLEKLWKNEKHFFQTPGFYGQFVLRFVNDLEEYYGHRNFSYRICSYGIRSL